MCARLVILNEHVQKTIFGTLIQVIDGLNR